MRQKALLCWFLFFGSAWISDGWGAVGWGCKSYLGPGEIVSFFILSFSHLNQIWFKCEIPLLFFLIMFYYAHLMSSRPQMFFKIGVRKILLIWQENICVGVFLNKVAGLRAYNFIKKWLQHRCVPVKVKTFLRTPPVAASVHIIHTWRPMQCE